MAKPKFDGIVEAAHYEPNGQLVWVRAFERRGATFSDWVLIPRQELIKRLQAGKKYYAGKRVEYNASTFEVANPLRLVTQSGSEYIASGESLPGVDYLENVPVI
jgi:hypothetical protein